jgi:alanine-synthesizing transaminase
LVQGTGFNWPTPDHFRVVFLPAENELREAINRLSRFLAKCVKHLKNPPI